VLMFERFTTPARESVVRAQDAARRLGDDHIGVEHLLLGLLAEREGIASTTLAELGVTTERVERELAAIRGRGRGPLGPAEAEALRTIGIDLEAIRRRVEASFGPGALDRGRARRRGHLPFTKEAKKTIELGLREAIALKHKEIGAEHVLLGLTRAPDEPAAGVLRALQAPPEAIRANLLARMRKAS
jgi:ATP-dependent Clp protease ATP-binding subunit ClpA